MTRGEFVNKYRERFGCDGSSKICWCKICCALDLIWEEMIEECKKRLKVLQKEGD